MPAARCLENLELSGSIRLNLSIAFLLLDEESKILCLVNRLRDTPEVILQRILLICMPISELKYCCNYVLDEPLN